VSTPDPVSTPGDDRNGVQVIRRAVQILNALRDERDGASLSQIAERTGLARSTVHRLVGALESERLIATASRSGRFRLGPAFSTYAQAAEFNFALDFHPVMSRLSQSLNETVDLAVLEHDHARIVHQIAATRRLYAVSLVGAVFPTYCTACGKALLAELPDEQVERVLGGRLERHTPHTVVDVDALLAELEQVRETRIAYDREEHTIGICAVGTSLTDAAGRVVAMSVPMPAQRFAENETAAAEALLAARNEVARA